LIKKNFENIDYLGYKKYIEYSRRGLLSVRDIIGRR